MKFRRSVAAIAVIGGYVLISIVVAHFSAEYIGRGHTAFDIPMIAWLVAGPMVVLPIGHVGFSFFLLATFVCLPFFCLAAGRADSWQLFLLVGVGLWVASGGLIGISR